MEKTTKNNSGYLDHVETIKRSLYKYYKPNPDYDKKA